MTDKDDIMDLDDFHEHMDRKDRQYEVEREFNEGHTLSGEDDEGTWDFFIISGPYIPIDDPDIVDCEACEDTGLFDGDDGEELICDECDFGKAISDIHERCRNEQAEKELEEFFKDSKYDDDEEIDRLFKGNRN